MEICSEGGRSDVGGVLSVLQVYEDSSDSAPSSGLPALLTRWSGLLSTILALAWVTWSVAITPHINTVCKDTPVSLPTADCCHSYNQHTTAEVCPPVIGIRVTKELRRLYHVKIRSDEISLWRRQSSISQPLLIPADPRTSVSKPVREGLSLTNKLNIPESKSLVNIFWVGRGFHSLKLPIGNHLSSSRNW